MPPALEPFQIAAPEEALQDLALRLRAISRAAASRV